MMTPRESSFRPPFFYCFFVTPRVPNSQSLSWCHLIVVQYPAGIIPWSEYKKHPHGQWSQWNVEFPYIHHGFVERVCLINERGEGI